MLEVKLAYSSQLGLWAAHRIAIFSDERGKLGVVEGGSDAPFDIKRMYFIFDVGGRSVRAGHAHKRLHQLFIPLSGHFNLHLDDGRTKETLRLSDPGQGLHVRPGVWRVVDGFSDGAVCVVLASEHFDEGDYIRDYDSFCQYVLNGDNDG